MNMYGGAVAGGSGQVVRISKYKLYRALTVKAEEKTYLHGLPILLMVDITSILSFLNEILVV